MVDQHHIEFQMHCPTNLYLLLRDYLSDHKAVIKNHFGNVGKTTTGGTPQGYVLEPTMRNIVFYSKMVDGITEIAFIDDKAIMVTGSSRR